MPESIVDVSHKVHVREFVADTHEIGSHDHVFIVVRTFAPGAAAQHHKSAGYGICNLLHKY